MNSPPSHCPTALIKLFGSPTPASHAGPLTFTTLCQLKPFLLVNLILIMLASKPSGWANGSFVRTTLPMFGFVVFAWWGLSQLMESKLAIRVSL